jgi:hypothetical protein
MESKTIKRPLSGIKKYSEKDVVLFLEKFLKGSLCGDSFDGCPWGETENERLYFALSEISYEKFVAESMRCETCKWWQQENTEYSIPANSYCINPKTNVGNPRGDRARVISTGPRFSCCHWEGMDDN